MSKPSDSSMDLSEILKLAQTDAGRQLIQLFQEMNPNNMDAIKKNAAAGDYRLLQKNVTEFMNTPQAQAIIRKLRG